MVRDRGGRALRGLGRRLDVRLLRNDVLVKDLRTAV